MTQSNNDVELKILHKSLNEKTELFFRDVISTARKTLPIIKNNKFKNTEAFKKWLEEIRNTLQEKYSSHLFSEGINGTDKVKLVSPKYQANSPEVDGRIILRDNFDKLLENDDRLIIFGEDCGKIGGVNPRTRGTSE